MDTDELYFTDIQALAKRIESGEISPVDITKLMLARIEDHDPDLKSYATVMAKEAMREARMAQKEIQGGTYRGPLHGVPIAVKDLCFTKGVRTMGGTKALADHVPDFDSTVVARLRAAGAVILGKLNLTEGAMGGYNPDFDAPVNPWDETRWTGVSSSGSGVATAAGLCYASLGSDTGGSIRFPAACNGIVGLKPTWGRVSRYGVLALADSLDHVGPLARTAADTAIVLHAIAGHDPNDLTSLSEPVPDFLAAIGRGIEGLKIGVNEDYLTKGVGKEVHAAVAAALEVLEGLGAKLVEVVLPRVDDIPAAWNYICAPEAVLAHQDTYPSRADDYGPWFKGFLEFGSKVTGAEYARANNIRARFSAEFKVLLKKVDAIACPTMSLPPFPVTPEFLYGPFTDSSENPIFNKALQYTAPYDFSGSPTLSLPCGFTEDGLPISLQLIGRHLEEQMLCQAGHAYQSRTDWHLKRPSLEKA